LVQTRQRVVVGADGGDEFFGAVEGAAADGWAGDDREADLEEVQPRSRGAGALCAPPLPDAMRLRRQ
jgi:hypothetical protein